MTLAPIERAARALCQNPSEDPDEVIQMSDGSFAPRWKAEVWRVHAVLRAIREPDVSASDAGFGALDMEADCSCSADAVWKAMIDDLLDEDAA